MRRVSWWMAIVVVTAATALAGCGTDLGKCDMTAATAVVYAPDGTPYFEGQALVLQSCSGAFCHAASATGAARYGAPHGLDFDVNVLTPQSSISDVAKLKHGLQQIRDGREDLYSRVESGEMPPGKAGERPSVAFMRMNPAAQPALLQDVRSADGKQILRNWLACNAPVIAGTTDATTPSDAASIGAVVAAHANQVDPTFQSVFDNVLKASCASCHNRTAGNPYLSVQDLDFTMADAAYAGLVGKAAFATGACKAGGQLVIANDCKGSLLYQKLLPAGTSTGLCGSSMPLGAAPIAAASLAAICTWIDTGAAR